jgi:hypothetical protein
MLLLLPLLLFCCFFCHGCSVTEVSIHLSHPPCLTASHTFVSNITHM